MPFLPTLISNYLSLLDPECRPVVEVVEPAHADRLVKQRKVAFCIQDGQGYRIVTDQQSISSIVIDLAERRVTKYVDLFSEFEIVRREVDWLVALRNSGIAPSAPSATPDSLVTEYVGEPVRQYNLPADWAEQAERILAGLRAAKCCHNDIKCDNLTVLNGRLYLIDFGWATTMGSRIPSDWPAGIGRQHRIDIHRFDDRRAIYDALSSASRGEVASSLVMGG